VAHYRASLDTDWSIETVFAYLAEFSHTVEWDPGVVRARPVDGEGPVKEGSAFELVARFFRREVPLVYRVVQLESPRRVVLEAETGELRAVDTITCEPSARGTRVTWDAVLLPKGLRYLGDLPLHLAFQWVGRRALGGLRRRLAQPPPGVSTRTRENAGASSGA
jgi:hypothetical protein